MQLVNSDINVVFFVKLSRKCVLYVSKNVEIVHRLGVDVSLAATVPWHEQDAELLKLKPENPEMSKEEKFMYCMP